MITTILTTSYRRPILLKRLADVIVPLINKQNGKLKWRIVIDEITNNYDFVFEEITRDGLSSQDKIDEFVSQIKKIPETENSVCANGFTCIGESYVH